MIAFISLVLFSLLPLILHLLNFWVFLIFYSQIFLVLVLFSASITERLLRCSSGESLKTG